MPVLVSVVISVSAANSALHRAREALATRVGPKSTWSPDAASVDRSLLERYVRVWESSDLDAIVALLHDDVVLPCRRTRRGYAAARPLRASTRTACTVR